MRNLAIVWILLCCVLFPYSVNGQQKAVKYQDELDRARLLEEELSYEEALEIYRKLEEENEDDFQLKLSIASVYFRLHNSEEAMNWYGQVLGKAEQKKTEGVAPEHLYNYAELLLMNEQVEKALSFYQLYKQRNPNDSRTDRKIEGIEKRDEFEKQQVNYEITGLSINSEYPDFSPAFYGNGLAFVSGRKTQGSAEKGKTEAGYLDLYHSGLAADGSFTQPQKFNALINTDFHEGPAVFYDHDTRMIFTRNNSNDKMKSLEKKIVVRLQLLSSEKDSATGDWKKPVFLSINNSSYSVGHPAISRDGKQLYFSSDIPGGYGGTDLYVSKWSGTEWGKPENLGAAVNTEGNEMFPFLHRDEVLYFASDGHPGLGGLDIYGYHLGDGAIRNMGKPVNSNRDDLGLILDEEGLHGYFSSNRGKSNNMDDNIYSLVISRPAPVAREEPPVEAPVVVSEDTVTLEVFYTVQLLALKSSKLVPLSFFGKLEGVIMYNGKDGLHRYTYGRYATLDEAVTMLKTLQEKGYNDAFVRREERYVELSAFPGVSVEQLRKKNR